MVDERGVSQVSVLGGELPFKGSLNSFYGGVSQVSVLGGKLLFKGSLNSFYIPKTPSTQRTTKNQRWFRSNDVSVSIKLSPQR